MLPILESRRTGIEALCRTYGVTKLDVFGSAVTGNFEPGRSDVDFVVAFGRNGPGTLFQRYFGFRRELAELLDCNVDLVMVGALKNRFFIQAVNETRRPLYAA
jgi:hypothetical protein